jgi:cytochrome c553
MHLATSGRFSRIIPLSLATIFFVAVLALRADIHPVPLEKNATSAQSLECHAEKAKGKFVHTAVSAGCTSCHEVPANKDVTRVKLVTTTPYSLFELSRRQERRRHQGHSAQAGGARLSEVPRPTFV